MEGAMLAIILSPMRSSLDKALMALMSSSVIASVAAFSSFLTMWLAMITVAKMGKPFLVFRLES